MVEAWTGGTVEDEVLLLDVLNSAPVVDGQPTEELDAGFATARGGAGTPSEVAHLRQVRDELHGVVRGVVRAGDGLQEALAGVGLRPTVTEGGLRWDLDAPDDRWLAARVVLAWARVAEQAPGRLRACANDECNLFLVDHSRPGTARWCSMATCGNRMKARAHAIRRRAGADGG